MRFGYGFGKAFANTADSLSCLRWKSISKATTPAVLPAASQTLLNIHDAMTYITTATAINIKSPREKENSMIKVKHTIKSV